MILFVFHVPKEQLRVFFHSLQSSGRLVARNLPQRRLKEGEVIDQEFERSHDAGSCFRVSDILVSRARRKKALRDEGFGEPLHVGVEILNPSAKAAVVADGRIERSGDFEVCLEPPSRIRRLWSAQLAR